MQRFNFALFLIVQPSEVHLPDFIRLLPVRWWIVQANTNSRLEGLVKSSNPIRSQEQYSREVFEHAQEDGYKTIPSHIGVRSSSEKDISLIKQKDAIP